MGNAACSTGQNCCSGTSRPPEVPNPGEVGGPVTPAPVRSHEVMGVEPMEAPGFQNHHVQVPGFHIEPGLHDEEPFVLQPPGEADTSDVVADGNGAAVIHMSDEDAQEKVSYEDGSSYAGQVDDGKRHGHGLWQSRTGQYEGQWQGDIQHGKGRQTWSDGRVYEGQFQSGKFAGCGKMIWHTQKGLLIYEGEYKDDLKCGKGKFVWADGRTYDGEWLRGRRHGRGMYMNARCEQKVGFWSNDRFERWEKSGTGNGNGGGKSSGGPDDDVP